MDKLLKIKDICFGFVKKEWQSIFKPVAVLLAICIVISLALSVTNAVTVEKISALEEQKKAETMSSLVKADKFEEKRFKEEFNYFVAIKNKKEIAYIYTTAAKGYGGDVSVMTAVDADGKVIEVAILDVSGETPGLGQNAANKTFYSQFAKKVKDVVLVKNGAESEKNQINAVTGATITSKAVTLAVNEALDCNSKVIKELKKAEKPKQEVTQGEEQ